MLMSGGKKPRDNFRMVGYENVFPSINAVNL